MTEEQAREKWCPMVRVSSSKANGYEGCNKVDTYVGVECMCMASDCMMWVWDVKKNLNIASGKFYNGESQGHCGLAR